MRLLRIPNDIKDTIRKKFEEELDNLDTSKVFKFEYDINKNLSPEKKSKVILSQNAYIKIKTLVNKASGEIGWNGVVEVVGDREYKITDILVYPQIVTAATVTCDELETGKWLSTLPDEIFNNLRFQAHSHVNMATSPSATDRTMFEKYYSVIDSDDDNPFYIFMIFNKKEEFYVEIVDVKSGLIYHKNDIEVVIEGVDEFWEESSKNVETYTPTPTKNPFHMVKEDETNEFETCKEDCKNCKKKKQCLAYYIDKMEELGVY